MCMASKNRGRFQVLSGDVSGEVWMVAESDDPREAFAEYDALQAQGRRYHDADYAHLAVWDDQRDRQVADLESALDTLEEEADA